MGKSILIHIGLPKTATTFLQNNVFGFLSNSNYLHPEFVMRNYAFQKLLTADDSLYDKSEFKGFLDKIYETNQKNIILSNENFSGRYTNMGCIERSVIAKRLKEIFPHAHILLVLRGQRSIIVSSYNQWIKGWRKGFKTIENFIGTPGLNYTYSMYLEYQEKYGNDFSKYSSVAQDYWYYNPYHKKHLDDYLYFPFINIYKNLFEKVTVLLYEDLNNNPLLFLNRLEDIFEEKINKENILGKENQKANVSLTSQELNLRLFKNKVDIFTNSGKLRNLLTKLYILSQKFQEKKKIN